MKKGSCKKGAIPRVGKVGDAKPMRGNTSNRRSAGRKRK